MTVQAQTPINHEKVRLFEHTDAILLLRMRCQSQRQWAGNPNRSSGPSLDRW